MMEKEIEGIINHVITDEEVFAERINYFMRSFIAIPIFGRIGRLVGLGFDKEQAETMLTLIEDNLTQTLRLALTITDPNDKFIGLCRGLARSLMFVEQLAVYALKGDGERARFLMLQIDKLTAEIIDQAIAELLEQGIAEKCTCTDLPFSFFRLNALPVCPKCNGMGVIIRPRPRPTPGPEKEVGDNDHRVE